MGGPRWIFAAFFFAVCCSTGITGCSSSVSSRPAVFTGRTMGTTYTVKIYARPTATARSSLPSRALHAGIRKRLQKIDRQMSTWRSDSEISRFNASRQTDWFPVSPATARVVQEAIRISRLSGGAFDVTVAPLVNLWSFGPEMRPRRVPSPKEIADRKRHVGYRKLQVRLDPPALKKTDAELSVDLSAIAKGYAVDQIAEYLDGFSPLGYMVEIGGEVRCRGTKPDGKAWHIGIQSPQEVRPQELRVIAVRNQAVATSGDYRNYFEQNGRRYSHTIDPRTGAPVKHRLASVTVLHKSCMTADALATAIMVLGPEAGYNWAQRHRWAVLMLVAKPGGGFEERETDVFRKPREQGEKRLPR